MIEVKKLWDWAKNHGVTPEQWKASAESIGLKSTDGLEENTEGFVQFAKIISDLGKKYADSLPRWPDGTIIGNRENVPQIYIDACMNDKYSKGDADFSVTGLMQPPYKNKLFAKHKRNIVVDVAAKIDALMGTAMHIVLEQGREFNENPDYITEKRVFTTIGGKMVSGCADVITNDGMLSDHKNCSVWKAKFGQTDWEKQLNMYAYMLKVSEDIAIKKLEVTSKYKDWSPSRAKREHDYPQSKVETHEIKRWQPATVQAYMIDRIKLHVHPDPPPCNDEDMWTKPAIWAVHKGGAKRATKLCDTKEEAEGYITSRGVPNPRIEYRPGERTRCENQDWCSVRDFCPEYAKYLKERK
jgi:hypothetical protein